MSNMKMLEKKDPDVGTMTAQFDVDDPDQLARYNQALARGWSRPYEGPFHETVRERVGQFGLFYLVSGHTLLVDGLHFVEGLYWPQNNEQRMRVMSIPGFGVSIRECYKGESPRFIPDEIQGIIFHSGHRQRPGLGGSNIRQEIANQITEVVIDNDNLGTSPVKLVPIDHMDQGQLSIYIDSMENTGNLTENWPAVVERARQLGFNGKSTGIGPIKKFLSQ